MKLTDKNYRIGFIPNGDWMKVFWDNGEIRRNKLNYYNLVIAEITEASAEIHQLEDGRMVYAYHGLSDGGFELANGVVLRPNEEFELCGTDGQTWAAVYDDDGGDECYSEWNIIGFVPLPYLQPWGERS